LQDFERGCNRNHHAVGDTNANTDASIQSPDRNAKASAAKHYTEPGAGELSACLLRILLARGDAPG
jgi:hypothetical protein